jgi:putative transposase
MKQPHRKTVRSFNIPGEAHELTFSCFRRLPLLSRDRTRLWLLDAFETTRQRRNLALWGLCHHAGACSRDCLPT